MTKGNRIHSGAGPPGCGHAGRQRKYCGPGVRQRGRRAGAGRLNASPGVARAYFISPGRPAPGAGAPGMGLAWCPGSEARRWLPEKCHCPGVS